VNWKLVHRLLDLIDELSGSVACCTLVFLPSNIVFRSKQMAFQWQEWRIGWSYSF